MAGLRAALAKGPVWALGAMSGTSLDGVDAALVQTDGDRLAGFGPTAYRPYSAGEAQVLRAALGQWPGPQADRAAEVVELAHAELLSGLPGAALVGFHGQTLAHDPRGRGTHQAGDGQVLAEALGLPVVWDFRSTDIDMGGEGAPLAPFFHFACARWFEAEGPVCFLNLGGVGNLTWVDPSKPAPEAEGACLAFDTGPANAPVNDLVAARRGLVFDEGGALAAAGEIDDAVLSRFLASPYFLRMPPKSLDRDEFGWLLEAVAGLGDADAAATLTAAAAAAVAEAMTHLPGAPGAVYVTGGGRHNPVLMALLDEMLAPPVAPVEEVGLNGDMLEAQAFAYLAVRAARGLPTSAPGTTGVRVPVGGARLSLPGAGGAAERIGVAG
jgi:anhydro-N-acetylmuramic acid kinase